MGWIQLQLSTTPEQAEELETLFEQNGSLAVSMQDAADQPLFEPARGETPLWNLMLMTALYPADINPEELLARLKQSYQPGSLPAIDIKLLQDEDWERSWMSSFKPIRCGGRLWICPSWESVPDPTAVTLILDPGLAFGTGTHPTTALCLEWLDAQDLTASTLIDYGCGSGILAIAALLLGADRVYAVDNDPQALLASADNAAKNRIDPSRMPLFLPPDFLAQIKSGDISSVDIVAANILAGPLISLAPYLSALVKPGGHILLSGILTGQADEVLKAYGDSFEFDPLVQREGWVRISGRRLK